MNSNQYATLFTVIVPLILAMLVSIYLSHKVSVKLKNVNRFVIYLLPVTLIVLAIPLSWLPSAYLAGLVIGVAVTKGLSTWLGFFAFGFFSLVLCLGTTWVLIYPAFYWISTKSDQ
jgi:hypothetical protein